MPTLFQILFFLAVLLAGGFVTYAVIGLIQAALGRDEETVRRRLSDSGGLDKGGERVDIIRRRNEDAWYRHLPFHPQLQALAERSGTGATVSYIWIQIAIFSALIFVVLAFVLPLQYLYLALIIAPIIGLLLVILNLRMQANKRRAKFEGQLPDALDLMVRSLRVGHPVTAAISTIAKEMPAPLGPEFAIASEEVTYGHDVPTAFRAMAERVPAQDLGFLNVVLQVQQDSGGNLVEALSGLSKVIRERYRMFRKVKSITVEGRISAWILSLFPIVLVPLLMWVKPGFFDQAMGLEIFPILVVVAIFLFTVNVIAMRMITNIKV
jgi:tight adherence protein B